jgi:hypothetical protein
MENQKKVYRKAVLSDFITDINLPDIDKKSFINNEKIKKYKPLAYASPTVCSTSLSDSPVHRHVV